MGQLVFLFDELAIVLLYLTTADGPGLDDLRFMINGVIWGEIECFSWGFADFLVLYNVQI